MSPRPTVPMTVLVIDRSSGSASGIIERLERAGHRLVHIGNDHPQLQDWLDLQDLAVLGSDQPLQTGFEHDGITIDPDQRSVRVHGAPIELSRLEFELLLALIDSPRRVLTHGELAERVWENCDVGVRTLSMLMSRLRRRIIDAGGPRVGQAVHGVGYRLACVG